MIQNFLYYLYLEGFYFMVFSLCIVFVVLLVLEQEDENWIYSLNFFYKAILGM
jgi:hypothetical protein